MWFICVFVCLLAPRQSPPTATCEHAYSVIHFYSLAGGKGTKMTSDSHRHQPAADRRFLKRKKASYTVSFSQLLSDNSRCCCYCCNSRGNFADNFSKRRGETKRERERKGERVEGWEMGGGVGGLKKNQLKGLNRELAHVSEGSLCWSCEHFSQSTSIALLYRPLLLPSSFLLILLSPLLFSVSIAGSN